MAMAADQSTGCINADAVLVSVVTHVVLDPPGIQVLLPQLAGVGLPLPGHLALLDSSFSMGRFRCLGTGTTVASRFGHHGLVDLEPQGRQHLEQRSRAGGNLAHSQALNGFSWRQARTHNRKLLLPSLSVQPSVNRSALDYPLANPRLLRQCDQHLPLHGHVALGASGPTAIQPAPLRRPQATAGATREARAFQVPEEGQGGGPALTPLQETAMVEPQLVCQHPLKSLG